MSHVVTSIDALVDPEREAELLAGFAALGSHKPEGLVRSELLRGQEGRWRIQTTWRDLESLLALRKSGEPPAALALLESVGAEHTHGWFTVEVSHG
jgi:hypothetical protein